MGMEDYPISGMKKDNEFSLINESGKKVKINISKLTEKDRAILESATLTFFDINHADGKLDDKEREYMYLNLKDPYLIDYELTSDEIAQLDGCIKKREEQYIKILKIKNIGELDKTDISGVLRRKPETDEELEKVRVALANKLGEYNGVYAQTAVEALKEILEDAEDKPSVLAAAAKSIGMIGTPGACAAPALLKILKGQKNKGSILSLEVMFALGRIEVSTDDIISVFKEIVKEAVANKNDFVSASAIGTLGALGYKAEGVDDFIIDLLKNKNNKTSLLARKDASYALGDMAFKSGVPAKKKKIVSALTETLKTDKDDKIKEAIVESLGKIGEPAAEEAVPVFIGILESKGEKANVERIEMPAMKTYKVETYKDIFLRSEVIKALPKMGKKAKDAIPALKKAAKDRRYDYINMIDARNEKNIIKETLDILEKM